MICFRVSSTPSICDTFTYDGRDYQLITNPKDSGFQGGLLRANARYTNGQVCLDKVFYFEVNP